MKSVLPRLGRSLTFQNSHSCNRCIHGFSSLAKDGVTSFQSCLQRRLVQSLPLWSRCSPGYCASAAMNDQDKLLPTTRFVRKQRNFLLHSRHTLRGMLSDKTEVSGLRVRSESRMPAHNETHRITEFPAFAALKDGSRCSDKGTFQE